MTSYLTRLARSPRGGARFAAADLLLLAIATVPLLAGCNSRVSATEVRANGAALGGAMAAATAGPRAPQALVPPPVGTPPRQPAPVAVPAISARSAIVIDDATGAVLYEFNGRARIPPASLTKIATAALAIERGRLDEWVAVDFDYTDPGLDDASVMGLERGDRFPLRDLIYGMLLPSGADASIVVARTVSGSEQAFVSEMNRLMESLGLFDTHFIDPHGLGGPTHLSTAYDMAMLSRYAMRQPLFAQVARTRAWKAVGSRIIDLYNTNLWAFAYEGGDGVKSGFTEEAGPTLAASATRTGHRVIVVVLDSTRRQRDTTALMDWAFETFCWDDGALGCRPVR
ncbi:MAG: D-alanyl-D-alanine carboxypeptidase [Dehalococcoidia bacterium]|nr:D-alanyl-D-alanine carboxypeptidase [Dehalococcoidia bacterium]